MKILFLVSSLNAGGAERVATTLASAWVQRGHEVTLVSTYAGGVGCFYPLDHKVNLVWLAQRLKSGWRFMPTLLAKLRILRAMMRDDRPDVVVSFLTNVNVMALLARRGLQVPIIVCERSNPAAARNVGRVLGALRRLSYPWASAVTLQTQASTAVFLHMVPRIRRLEVVPNPLPAALLERPLVLGTASQRAEKPLLPGLEPQSGTQRKRLMSMGRLVPAKQFHLLIDVFARLAAEFPDWDLFIWGEGPMRAALLAQLSRLGLQERVFLPGQTDTPWDALSGADVFALTSAVEGFPNVLLEAMALGLPCIAFDCPSGPAEISRQGEDAMLVPNADVDALYEGLSQLMHDPDLRMELARRAAKAVRERYALARVLDRWDELFGLAGCG